MNYSTCNEPVALPNELKCCCTPDSPNREVSMASILQETSDKLCSILTLLERLDIFVFNPEKHEGPGAITPECLRDAIYANNALAGQALDHLAYIVERFGA